MVLGAFYQESTLEQSALLEQILFDMLLFTDFDNGTGKTLVNLTNF